MDGLIYVDEFYKMNNEEVFNISWDRWYKIPINFVNYFYILKICKNDGVEYILKSFKFCQI